MTILCHPVDLAGWPRKIPMPPASAAADVNKSLLDGIRRFRAYFLSLYFLSVSPGAELPRSIRLPSAKVMFLPTARLPRSLD